MLHIASSDLRTSAYMRKVDEILADAHALREKLRNQLASVEKSIAAFEQMKRDIPEADLDRILTRPDESGEAPAPKVEGLKILGRSAPTTPAEVVVLASEELLAKGRPMKRGALVRALEARGVRLAGSDKNKNLGTILWRHPNDFVSLERLGYWVRGVPLQGVYDPEDFTRKEEDAEYAKYREIRFELQQIQADHTSQSAAKRSVLGLAQSNYEKRYPSFSDRWLADPFR